MTHFMEEFNSPDRNFTSYHSKLYNDRFQLRRATLIQLDKMLKKLVLDIGKEVGAVANREMAKQEAVNITVMPEHYLEVFKKLNLSEEYLKDAFRRKDQWVSNTLKKHLQPKRRKSKRIQEFVYPLYVEQRDIPKKPGLETQFRKGLFQETRKDLRIHRDVFILIAAVTESIMYSVIKSASIITRESNLKQITLEHLNEALIKYPRKDLFNGF